MVTTRRAASVPRPIEDTEALIDHLRPMLTKLLVNDVSRVYFGDVGVYLPSHFLGPRKEARAVLAISPAFDRLKPGTRVSSQEVRLIGVDIVGLVNITPYFEASPEEAYGERQLASLMRKIRVFLSQQENVNLDGRIRFLDVGDIGWNWLQRKDLSLRGAALTVTAEVTVSRMKNVNT